VAEPHLYPRAFTEIQERADFDYIIGSVHWVGPNFMFDERFFRQHTADEVYRNYFTELEQMVIVSDIDIVAHLDIPVRTAKPFLDYDPLRYEAQLHGILSIIIDRGLALDINTGGKRKPASNLMPDPLIVKWYAEMGGVHVTLGSDAHQADQVGLHLNTAMDAVRAAGLTQLTQFDLRKARLIPL
jgi:histidinol-phosphatase (PHP family)